MNTPTIEDPDVLADLLALCRREGAWRPLSALIALQQGQRSFRFVRAPGARYSIASGLASVEIEADVGIDALHRLVAGERIPFGDRTRGAWRQLLLRAARRIGRKDARLGAVLASGIAERRGCSVFAPIERVDIRTG